MEPALLAGDRVIVSLWTYRNRDPAPGDVALLFGPGDRPMVKRVVARVRGRAPGDSPLGAEWGNGPAYAVAGDNPAASIDSRQFGPVPRHRFRGRVVWRYWPLSRAGPIR
jgi:signal peptidase I